jgi:hypothetical protein
MQQKEEKQQYTDAAAGKQRKDPRIDKGVCMSLLFFAWREVL